MQVIPKAVNEDLFWVVDNVGNGRKPIIFTSPRPGAGASSIAYQSAISVVARNTRVLLIDCNFRSHGCRELSHLRSGHGLAEAVSGDQPLEQCHQSLISERVRYMPPGDIGGGIHGFFDSDDFPAFLDTISSDFTHILLDAPAVLNYAETTLMARRGFPVIFVTDARKTRSQTVREARERILDAGGEVAGIILNRRPFYLPNFVYQML